jgi:Centrosomal spindle body, CEP44
MTTGDLKNNVVKLQQDLKTIKYKGDFNIFGITQGDPSALLPLLHAAFLSTPLVAQYLASKSYDLFGKKDTRFLESGICELR